MTGLYIHIPFCAKKCNYCDFYSLSGEEALIDDYIGAVLAESEKYVGMAFDTLYIGGGTPSLLGVRRLETLMDGLSVCFDLAKLREASIEMNPESASMEFLKSALALGISRVSIGVQSLDDEELRKAGRIHAAKQALYAVSNASGCGFTNVSVDIIAGLPGQTAASMSETMSQLCSTGLTHISVYCLSVEEHTPFHASPPLDLPDEESQPDLFNIASGHLRQCGFVHYEISNFSLPGKECLHNLNYWRGGEYVGLGPSSASHLDGTRFKNAADLAAYLHDPLTIGIESDVIEPRGKMAEEAMLRLRLLEEGLDLDDLFQGHSYNADMKDRLDRLAGSRMLTRAGNKYRIPPEGVLTSNQVFMNVLM